MKALILELTEGLRLAIAYLIYIKLNVSKVLKADFETMTVTDETIVTLPLWIFGETFGIQLFIPMGSTTLVPHAGF